jgi:multicomponent Na+:H+ antiporter subunit E
VTIREASAKAVGVVPAATMRGAGFLLLWLVIIGAGTSDLVVGLVTAAAATWASLRLLPPGPGRVRPLALADLALRFPGRSAIAGADVAWRALDPSLPLRPGFVRCPIRIAPGPARSAFCALSSLLPGALPVGPDHGDALSIHCLDVGQSVRAQIAQAEARFLRVLDRVPADG